MVRGSYLLPDALRAKAIRQQSLAAEVARRSHHKQGEHLNFFLRFGFIPQRGTLLTCAVNEISPRTLWFI